MISKYPDTNRKWNIILNKDQEKYNIIQWEYISNFFDSFSKLYINNNNTNVNTYWGNENCDYAEAVYGSKNWYLSFSFGANAENVMYSCFVRSDVKNIYNSFYVENWSENIYTSYFIQNSSFVFYSKYITNSNNIRLSTNLTWCSNCILCDNLENQSYCINNNQYSKEEYIIEKQKILSNNSKFDNIYSNKLNTAINKNDDNCSWVAIYNCNNIENGNLCRDMKDCRNVICGTWWYTWSSNIYDWLDVWLDTHDMYGTGMAGTNSEHLYCCSGITKCNTLFYSMYCEACSFCLWCIWLKNKSYCILNKQYTKEEWYEKVDEIFGQMDADGTLGEFFPACMNPFYFNDTAAYLIDPSFTKEEVTAKWYLWRDEPIKVDIPETAQVISIDDLDQYESFDDAGVWKIDASILKKVIQDHEGNVYTIQWLEYNFLIKHGLPLPRKHWLDRMKENFRIS